MNWLFEGNWTVYLVLLLLGGVFFGLWVNDRKSHWLMLLAVPLLLAATYCLLDRLIETRYEQISRKLQEMAAAVAAQDAGRIYQHLSPTFKYGSYDRESFRRFAEEFLREGRFDSLEVWEIRVDGREPGLVTLRAKPKGGITRGEFFFVKTRWVQDRDNQWRLTGFTVHNPYSDSDTPLDVTRVR
jgi:hypothetical protein